jgi:hypothetical protein
MATTHYRAPVLTFLFVFACKVGGNGGDDDSPAHDPLIQLCIDNCVKPLCMGNIEVEGDYLAVCESLCQMRVAQAEEDDCVREYEDLLMCLEETSCGMYSLWFVPGHYLARN